MQRLLSCHLPQEFTVKIVSKKNAVATARKRDFEYYSVGHFSARRSWRTEIQDVKASIPKPESIKAAPLK